MRKQPVSPDGSTMRRNCTSGKPARAALLRVQFIHAAALAPEARLRVIQYQAALRIPGVAEIVAGEGAAIEVVVVGDNAAALTRSHVLVHLEAENADVAECADLFFADATAAA